MKKILINGAGRGCLNLIKTARGIGLYTIVTGMEGPCIPIANKAYRSVHPGHPDEVLQVAMKENVDGIATSCNDLGLIAVGYVCDQMGLTGLSFDSAQLCSDKLMMKQRLFESHVRTAKFHMIRSLSELEETVNELSLPVIIKATDLQGSRGIYIVRNEKDLVGAYKEVMSLTNKDYCIVEEFIEGKEFGAQAFVYKGEVLFIMPHGDETIMCKTAVPIGHYVPYETTSALLEDINRQAKASIKSLGLDNCAINLDFIERDNKAYVIELTGRAGANGLTDIVSKHFGINYYEMILAVAMGEDPRQVFSKKIDSPKAAMSRIMKSDHSGYVRDIFIANEIDASISFFCKQGSYVREFTNSNDAIGEVIATGNTLRDCETKINESVRQTYLTLEDYEINPEAEVLECEINSNAKIYYKSYIKNCFIGKSVVIRDFSRIENSVFEDHADVQRNAMMYCIRLGRFSYVGRNFTGWHASIGKFCSISWNVSIGGANHDYKRITQHAFLYSKQFGILGKDQEPVYNRFTDDCIVGNDVWIGCNAVINRGIKVGDGAVIAAGAVVTKDVKPYTIVAGVPAKQIGERCSPELAKRLIATCWWDMPDSIISDNIGLFANEISEQSVERIETLCDRTSSN